MVVIKNNVSIATAESNDRATVKQFPEGGTPVIGGRAWELPFRCCGFALKALNGEAVAVETPGPGSGNPGDRQDISRSTDRSISHTYREYVPSFTALSLPISGHAVHFSKQ
jgi:hypothetical protein